VEFDQVHWIQREIWRLMGIYGYDLY